MSEYKKITIKDVAREVGVSYAIVSAVLSGNLGKTIRVSESTQQKIIQKSKELGYVPNQLAKNLKQGNQSLIAVFTYENIFPIDSRNEFYDFFAGIQVEAEKLGFDLLVLNTKNNFSFSSRITLASGALLIGLSRNDEDLKALAQRNFPLVFVGRRAVDGINTHVVTFDYKAQITKMLNLVVTPEVKAVVYLKQTNSKEPTYDKEMYTREILEIKNIELFVNVIEDAYFSPEIQKQMLETRFVILDRLILIPSFNKWCEENGLVRGKDIFAVVFEDDWEGNYNDWIRFANARRELGSLAVKHLNLLKITQSTESLPRLIEAKIIIPAL